jgi:hypothetical protein
MAVPVLLRGTVVRGRICSHIDLLGDERGERGRRPLAGSPRTAGMAQIVSCPVNID